MRNAFENDMPLFQTIDVHGRMTGHADVNMVREFSLLFGLVQYRVFLLSPFIVQLPSNSFTFLPRP